MAIDLEIYKQDEKQAVLSYQLPAAFDEVAKRFQAEFVSMVRVDHRAFLRAINAYGTSCLDVGAAFAAQYFALKENFPHITYTGVELSPQHRDKIETFLDDEGVLAGRPSIVSVADYASLPFTDGQFDVVTSRSVLTHYKPEKGFLILDEMLRVAKKAVVIKFYLAPHVHLSESDIWEADLRDPDRGWFCKWAYPKWVGYTSKKTVKTFETENVIVIEKEAGATEIAP